ncbi:MAG: hypothetical protein WC806_06315 [Candidatus Gracilibacteria bacterium]|jgi:hypothetical protein
MNKKLDYTFIIDELPQKAEEIADVVSAVSGKVRVLLYTTETLDAVRQQFSEELHPLLENGKDVAVIFDCRAGVKGRVIETYRKAGEATGNRTRNVLVTCYHGRQLRKGFQERKVEQGDFRHVRYTLDDRRYLEQLGALFGV